MLKVVRKEVITYEYEGRHCSNFIWQYYLFYYIKRITIIVKFDVYLVVEDFPWIDIYMSESFKLSVHYITFYSMLIGKLYPCT